MPTNAPAPAPHYTATVSVTKTIPEHIVYNERGYEPRTIQRDVVELGKVSIRASSLDELKAKVIEHTKLVAE